jgi:alginate O-acetyltransferase complex protein AlgI
MWSQLTRTVAPRTAPHRQYAPIPRPTQTGHSLYPGEPETCRRNWLRFIAIWGHLALLYAVFLDYRLEGRAFRLLAAIALGALPVHYAIHYRWKKPFFLAISIAGLIWVFGLSVAAIVLPAAAVLIGVCYLPIAWLGRAAIIGALALAMAVLRGHTTSASFDCAWPILGSMFMFRMIIYLYELKHTEKRESLLDSLSYFFLLPNYCFLLFPVVDYRTFQRSYFAVEVHAGLRSGLRMIFRGTIHLLLYRLIYHELLIKADEVHSAASLAGFLVCNYLLYLRVSGQFHLACGMLQLFGFQLPETHRRYLLATGFTDYWRRINIYWKDFMVRIVFNPLVFRLKRWPQGAKLAVATAVVFLMTWLLHAYQSFWLRGTWGFSIPDALFWGILGVLVMFNVQLDARFPRRHLPKGIDLAPRALTVRALKIAGTFTTTAMLWSLWSSPSVEAWIGMFQRAFTHQS